MRVVLRGEVGEGRAVTKKAWKRVGGEAQLSMLGAASSIIDKNMMPTCPVCQGPLRFYYHEFKQTPRRSGTVWIWCGACGAWEHASRVELPKDRTYADPWATLNLDAFDRLERNQFLDQLERKWESGELPRQFTCA
jgi:hypothetical protein